MIFTKNWKNAILVSALFLYGCGGGGTSSSAGGGNGANHPPIANAGADKTVKVNHTVTITGSGSDPDGTIIAYEWKEGNLTLANQASFSYKPTSIGEHTLTLTVTDNDGAEASDSMVVNALVNKSPQADAGPNKSVELNHTVKLDGSGSKDPDGTIVAYQWKEGSKVLADKISFDYNGTSVGDHTLTLTVTDDDGATDTDTVTVKVTQGSSSNEPPVAKAGEDKTVEVNHTVKLDGSGSYDPDGSIVSYEWKEGGKVLSDKVSFDYTPTVTGFHTLTLTVKDDDGASSTDTIKIKTTKHLPLLVVRVEFKDYKFQHNETTWSNKFFGKSEGGQLNNYYDEISYGIFQFTKAKETHETANDGIVTVQLDKNHPGDVDTFDKDYLLPAIQKANDFVDFSQYDTNHDGAISRDELQIMFLVAGGESATGAKPGVWAHEWCFYGGNGDAPTHDGVELMSCSEGGVYSRFGEKLFDAKNGDDATIGVIAHELGHAVFGLPDLYDTDGSSSGIGDFGLMSGGSWAYIDGEIPGQTPVHMTGWSKAYAHFVKPVTVTNVKGLKLNATASSDYVLYKIETGVDKEYFLIENRAAKGYDRGLHVLQRDNGDFKGGALILHIDDNQNNNQDETHKWVDVEEADGENELDEKLNYGEDVDLFYKGNNTAFTPNTTPNSDTYNNGQSGVYITNISDRGDTMICDVEKK